ncbi:MAG: hypothetical protein AAF492_26585, partial [Verrucomicrobiota bacterium]
KHPQGKGNAEDHDQNNQGFLAEKLEGKHSLLGVATDYALGTTQTDAGRVQIGKLINDFFFQQCSIRHDSLLRMD